MNDGWAAHAAVAAAGELLRDLRATEANRAVTRHCLWRHVRQAARHRNRPEARRSMERLQEVRLLLLRAAPHHLAWTAAARSRIADRGPRTEECFQK